jgi:hypothetical protein
LNERNFNRPQTTSVSPDADPDPDPVTALRGNNGWGNDGEGINPGSDEGNEAQESSKSDDSDGRANGKITSLD